MIRMALFVAALEEVMADPKPQRIDGDCISDDELLKTARVSRNVFNILKVKLANLIRPTHRNHSFSLGTMLLMTLVFLASGSYQWVLQGYAGELSQGSISQIIGEVVDAICLLAPEYIVFPDTVGKQQEVKERFMAIAGLPNCLGCVDGTHVRLRAPTEDEHLFVDKNHNHSINVQVCCDATLRITDIVARYHGSTHDSFIFQNSALYDRLDSGELGEGFLLGDRGYALETFVMTPINNPTTPQQISYNDAHSLTRCKVECCIGVLKSRWRCLMSMLHYTPAKVCSITMACSVLHNLCHSDGHIWEVDDDVQNELVNDRGGERNVVAPDPRNRRQAADAVRNNIIHNFF